MIGFDLGGTRIEAVALGDEGEILARAMATVINVVDPDVIAPCGRLSGLERPYRSTDRLDTPVLAPRHGAFSGVPVAAWLWPPGGSELADDGAGP